MSHSSIPHHVYNPPHACNKGTVSYSNLPMCTCRIIIPLVGNSVAAAEFGPAPSVIVIRLECEGTENNVIECNISKHIEALEYAAIQCKDRKNCMITLYTWMVHHV